MLYIFSYMVGKSKKKKKRRKKSLILGINASVSPTLCNTMDCNPPGSSVQVRILEWVAILSSRESSQTRDQTRVSYASCTGSEGL